MAKREEKGEAGEAGAKRAKSEYAGKGCELHGKFKESTEELTNLIRSRHPIIYLESNESERTILEIINNICEQGTKAGKWKKQLYIWDIAKGLSQRQFRQGSVDVENISEAVQDPGKVLDYIEGQQPNVDACYVLCEFHHYLENPNIQRRLRNFVELVATKERKTLILLSPKNPGMTRSGKRVPLELENLIHIYDWPLPDTDVLKHYLESNLIPQINKTFEKAKVKKLNLNEDDMRDLIDASKGMTLAETESSVYSSAIEKFDLKPEVIVRQKKQIIKKSGLVEYIEPSNENLDDVGGIANLKEWLVRRQPILTEDAREFGCDTPNGMMLIGPWGTGKSSVAKAVINQWKLPGIRVDAAKLMESFVGSSERNTASALQLAESIAPCVLWWDEVDDLFSGGESSGVSDGGTTSRVIGIISTWMSEHKGLVFNIFTANDISRRPPKLFRKGRMDEIFTVNLPVVEEREDIFKIHINKRRPGQDYVKDQKIKVKKLAEESRMFSGAEIKEAVNAGFISAYNDSKRDVTTKDILEAIHETIPISCTMKEQLSEMRKWQEGRAVRASSFEPEDIIDVTEYGRKTIKTDEAPIDI